MSDEPLNVVQLSDLHFSSAPGGYAWRDTGASFAAVAELVMTDAPDLVVVTGDIANQGHADEYELAGSALAELGIPVYCLAGNHDFVDALHSFLPRPGVFVQRTLRVGGWLFLFGDSNEGGADLDPEQGWIDRPDRLHEAKGGLTGHEVSWLDRQLGMGGAEHVMLWLHHPPGSVRFFEQPDYDHQVAGLVSGAPTLRAMSAGHAHTACTREVGGIPSHVCPSTGLSVDLEEMVLMPPGYRRFQFWPDGSINTEVVWVDDERWNERHSLPQIAAEYLAGLVTAEDLRSELGLAPDEGWRGV